MKYYFKGVMNIEFFVEYPEEELAKKNLIDWDTTFYVASEFPTMLPEQKNLVWWPILSEGYYLSHLSPLEDILELKDKIETFRPRKVMLDLEISRKPEFKHIKKRLIEEIVEQVPYVISCEYPYITPKTEKLKRKFGLSIEADEKMYMCYISWALLKVMMEYLSGTRKKSRRFNNLSNSFKPKSFLIAGD